MKKTILAIVGIGLLLLSGCAAPASTSAPELSKLPKFDVPYVSDGNLRQKLDVDLPEGEDGPFPTIFAIYGGGFREGGKYWYKELASHFNELGYAFVSINYRLAPEFNYPAHVQDSYCALAWVHANAATYGFDTERIIALGDSSGGYLVAMLGTVDTPSLYMEGCPHPLPQTDLIQGVVVFYGVFDFTSIDGYPDRAVSNAFEPFWGSKFDHVPAEALAEMSPMSWVNGSEPPFLIIHGTNDETVPSWTSEEFASELGESGATVELLLLESGHGFINYAYPSQSLSSPINVQSLEAIEAFLASLFEG